MGWKGTAKVGIEAIALVLVIALVLGQLLGQPILLGFVTSDSMEPTMEAGDGFVAVPTAVAGPVEQGDVVVYRAETFEGGGLTTHRIVDRTDRGFITRGDGNPFTDQDNGEPPVRREQIVAVALQFDTDPVVIPYLGTFATGVQTVLGTAQAHLSGFLGTSALVGTQGLAYLIFALTLLLYVLDVWFSGDRRRVRDQKRETGMNTRLVVGTMALALVLAATVTMVAPAGTQSFDIVSAESPSERSDVVQRGTTESLQFVVGNGGEVPVYVFFGEGSDNIDISPQSFRVGGNTQRNGTLSLSAPQETGPYRYYLTEHRYLALLPESHVRTLYQMHPWLPIVVIDALIGVPFYLLGITLVGTERVRRRSRDAPSRTERLLSRLERPDPESTDVHNHRPQEEK